MKYIDRDHYIISDSDLFGRAGGEIARYVGRSYNYSLKTLDLPPVMKANLKFVEGPTAGQLVNQGGIILRPLLHLEYHWYQVPQPPWAPIYNCFSAGTEVLTHDGWKPFHRVSEKDSFLTRRADGTAHISVPPRSSASRLQGTW